MADELGVAHELGEQRVSRIPARDIVVGTIRELEDKGLLTVPTR